MTATRPDRLAETLIDSIGALTRRIRRLRVDEDLSQPESITLSSVARSDPMSSAELARLESVRPQSMHATITRLEQRGLVRRTADPADGRRMLVELTEAGRGRARDKRTTRSTRLAAVLESDFTEEERAALLAAAPLLERLAASV